MQSGHLQNKARHEKLWGTVGKVVAIIPARAGSKRLPQKNISDLGGQPLVSHTIQCAIDSQLFSEIVVSSDDPRVLAIAVSHGVTADRRPAHLCGDRVESFDVVAEYLERQSSKNRFEHVAKLLPTCPLRLPEDLVGAFALYTRHDCKRPVVAVREYEFPVPLAMELLGREGATVQFAFPEVYESKALSSQLMKKFYHPNGAVYLAPANLLLRTRTFFAKSLLGYVMPAERSVDIDYAHQFRLAEVLLSERQPTAKRRLG